MNIFINHIRHKHINNNGGRNFAIKKAVKLRLSQQIEVIISELMQLI